MQDIQHRVCGRCRKFNGTEHSVQVLVSKVVLKCSSNCFSRHAVPHNYLLELPTSVMLFMPMNKHKRNQKVQQKLGLFSNMTKLIPDVVMLLIGFLKDTKLWPVGRCVKLRFLVYNNEHYQRIIMRGSSCFSVSSIIPFRDLEKLNGEKVCVCMCVCGWVCVSMSLHVYVCIFVSVCMHTICMCMCLCMWVCVSMCAYVCVFALAISSKSVNACVCVFVFCVFVCVRVRACACVTAI